jgi:hypothetical protein
MVGAVAVEEEAAILPPMVVTAPADRMDILNGQI